MHHALNKTIQRDAGPQGSRGERIATRAGLLPGDLVFFRDGSGNVHHVGMSLGGDKFVHAPHTGDVVKVSSLNERYYASSSPAGAATGVDPGAAGWYRRHSGGRASNADRPRRPQYA